MLVEVIVTNTKEAIQAEQYGATRLELIHAFELGGLSPKLEITKSVCSAVKIPVNIMLRPHGNGFIYNKSHIQQIINELQFIKNETAANGIVFGALTKEKALDVPLLETVIQHKKGLQLTFHRAIDEANNIIQVYTQLLKYKEIDNVLTSGGKLTALAGADTLQQMIMLCSDKSNCQVIAGSGITPDNAAELIKATGVKQIHLGSGLRTNRVLDKKLFKQLFSCI